MATIPSVSFFPVPAGGPDAAMDVAAGAAMGNTKGAGKNEIPATAAGDPTGEQTDQDFAAVLDALVPDGAASYELVVSPAGVTPEGMVAGVAAAQSEQLANVELASGYQSSTNASADSAATTSVSDLSASNLVLGKPSDQKVETAIENGALPGSVKTETRGVRPTEMFDMKKVETPAVDSAAVDSKTGQPQSISFAALQLNLSSANADTKTIIAPDTKSTIVSDSKLKQAGEFSTADRLGDETQIAGSGLDVSTDLKGDAENGSLESGLFAEQKATAKNDGFQTIMTTAQATGADQKLYGHESTATAVQSPALPQMTTLETVTGPLDMKSIASGTAAMTPATQVAAVLSTRLSELDSKPVQTISIELHPAELGHLRIRVEQTPELITAQIIASEQMSADLLMKEKNFLLQTLSDLGFDGSSVDISHGNSHSDDMRGDTNASGHGQNQNSGPNKNGASGAAAQKQTHIESSGINFIV